MNETLVVTRSTKKSLRGDSHAMGTRVAYAKGLPDDLEHQIHSFLPISDVFLLMRLSEAVRKRIRQSFVHYRWDVAYCAKRDAKQTIWLGRIANANVNVRSVRMDNIPDVVTDVVTFGSVGAMKLLVKHCHVNINGVDSKNQMPLHCAARCSLYGMIRYLLSLKDIDVNMRDPFGITPLNYTIGSRNSVAVKPLLAHKSIDVNQPNNDHIRSTPVHVAAVNNAELFLNSLLMKPGIDLNAVDVLGRTALHRACLYGFVGIIKCLLRAPQILVNTANNRGFTPLLEAVRYNRLGAVELLLSHTDVDVNATDRSGKSALHVAASDGLTKIAKLLTSNLSINVNITDDNGDTALHLATFRQHTPIVTYLLELKDIRKDIRNNDGRTASEMLSSTQGRDEAMGLIMLAALQTTPSARI